MLLRYRFKKMGLQWLMYWLLKTASRQGVAVYRHFGFMKRGEETSRDGVMFTPMSLSQT